MRARKVSDQDIINLYEQGKNQKQIGEELGVSNVCIHKHLKRILVMQNLEKLTPKEQKFCIAVSEGKSRTQAIMEAYDVSSRESAKALQNTLREKPEIQESITALFAAHGSSLNHRIGVLAGHIDNKMDPHVSLTGLNMSFKLDGSYAPEKHEHYIEDDIDSIIRRIETRYSKTIDVTPDSEPSQENE